ncbi:MAG: tetraacyldisaccharide 4'-kinase [Alistipes sp.]|nr:tetraacyldisaccharide 4'-kinase [Alistipes sp.]
MKIVRGILSGIYAAVIATRHRLYDWGVFKSYSFDIPIVCIGNITVGGTGKTPTAEYLLAELAAHYKIAILSRGYGRTTKGYREVTVEDNYLEVGDEPLQIKLKFRDTVVVVAEDRVEAVQRIRREHPEVTLIVMDDGFQHRKLRAKVNILLVDSTRPIESDNLLPLGRLRDLKSRLSAAHFFIVTKCSDEMTPLDKRLWHNKLRSIAYQKVYFSTIVSRRIEPLFYFEDREEVNYGQQAIVLSGIGNPRPFMREVGNRFNVVGKLIFADHHRFNADDMLQLYNMHQQYPRAVIVMTEKDAVKLRRARLPESLMRMMYYQPINMTLVDGPDQDFVGNLISEIEYKDKRDVQGKDAGKDGAGAAGEEPTL